MADLVLGGTTSTYNGTSLTPSGISTAVGSDFIESSSGLLLKNGIKWDNRSDLVARLGDTGETVSGNDIFTAASGGTVTTSGSYTIHTFTSSGTFTIIASSLTVEYLVVAAGAGGGGGGGGGGAGGMRTGTYHL